MLNFADFTEGRTVYVLNFHHRDNFEKATLEEVVIDSVGRKYVSVGRDKFFLNNARNDLYLTQKVDGGTANYLFLTKEDYDRYSEYRELNKWFHNIASGKLTYEQLKAIKEIIENDQ